jgi:hypothetical protein
MSLPYAARVNGDHPPRGERGREHIEGRPFGRKVSPRRSSTSKSNPERQEISFGV